MQILSVSETRANLKAVLDRVVAERAPTYIKRPKGENVVMIAESEWEGLQETLHLLSSPKNAERLLGAVRRMDGGSGEEHELIEPTE